MSIANFIGILGIILTIVIGIFGIFYAFKLRNFPRITYIREAFIPLFRSIAKNMNGLEINFEGKPISPSLLLLKGAFVNTGNSDIDSSGIHEQLRLLLPQSCRFIKAKIIKSSSKVNATATTIDDFTLEFSWELLKKNEFFHLKIFFNPFGIMGLTYFYSEFCNH